MRQEASRPKHSASPPAEGGFHSLGLSAEMLEAVQAAQYVEPTPVQSGLIPRALAGADLIAQAQTGTGKTAAFVIPILETLKPRAQVHGVQALVLVPTRELAVQVEGEFVKLARGRSARVVAVYGGKPIRRQVEKLHRGADVVVGTPGRVLDHLGRGTLNLDHLQVVVLDEADRMLDIGFRPDIEKILRRCPRDRQTLLLSATVPPPVERLASRYMREPEKLNYSPEEGVAVETIEQKYFTVPQERKFELLVRLLKRDKPRQAIIFCRTKRGTENLYQKLAKRFEGVGHIHGDLAQRVRDRVMQQFREGKVAYLVATDVVGRGIDVSSISHIINFDIPQFSDDYVHRVGRTGRMGREGVAYTFVTAEQGSELTRIEVRINRLLERDDIEGLDLYPKTAPEVTPAERAASEPSPAAPAAEESQPARPVFGQSTRRYRRRL